MCYMFYVDGKAIPQAQTIELSKIPNICTASVRHEAMFTDTMQSPTSYARALKDKHGVRFVDALIWDVVETIISYNFLAANSRSTNVYFIRIGTIMVMNRGVLLLLGKLFTVTPAAKTAGITHNEDPSLYVRSEEDILLVIQVADVFFKNDIKPGTLQQNLIYGHASALLDEVHVRHLEKAQA